MCLPKRNGINDAPFEALEDLRQSRLGTNADIGRGSLIIGGERFGSIIDGRAARSPSIIDTKYKDLADLKE